MNYWKRIKVFVNNIISLIVTLWKNEIYWNTISIEQRNCNINKMVKLYKPYVLKEVSVEYGSYISQNAVISLTSIGKFCSIGPNLVCGWGIHPTTAFSTSPIFYSNKKQAGFTYTETNKLNERKEIKIGNDVFIGANVTILDGVKIGNGAIIGAGAVVSKDIPPYAIAVGCPIEIIKYRFDEEIIRKLEKNKWWDKDEYTLKKALSQLKDVYDMDSFLSILDE